MRSGVWWSLPLAGLALSCGRPISETELVGIWRASSKDSTLPQPEMQLPVMEIIFSKQGYDCPALETNGKWSVQGQTLVLHPAVKSRTLEFVDIGKVQPGRQATPIRFDVRDDDTKLVWSPKGGDSARKPIYVFEKEGPDGR